MDGLSAFVCSAQAVGYALSIVKSLNELRNALRHGDCFLHDAQASVGHLREIIIQLIPQDDTPPDSGLGSLLQSINVTVDSLLVLFKQQNRLQLVLLLVIRRAEVNDSLALLERKKNTLILYLTAQNSTAIASLKPLQSTRAIKMAQQSDFPSEDSGYSTDSSGASSIPQPNQRTLWNGELPPIAQQASTGSNGAEHDPLHFNPSPSLQQQPSTRPLPPKKKSDGTAAGKLRTKGNKVTGEARQLIGGLNRQGMNATHTENIAGDTAYQCIGVDVKDDFLPHFFESHPRAQGPKDNTSIKKDNASRKKHDYSIMENNTSSKKDNAISKKHNASIKKHDPSIMKDYASTKKDNASSEKHNASIKKHDSSIINDNTSSEKDYASIKKYKLVSRRRWF